jgi:hypothetical protein
MNEKLFIKSKTMRWVGHVASIGYNQGAYRILMGKPEGCRSLGKPTSRWHNNNKMDLQDVV